MEPISGHTGPHDRQKYERDYKQGAELFQKALNQYTKSDNPYQKAEFKGVMDKAMHVLNDSAHGLMRKELEQKNSAIAKDYATFKKHSDDPDTIQKLNADLDDAKKSV